MTSLPRRHRHIGAYGICIVKDHVLLIRKARGPYTGLLDLPGGGIEFGEEPEAALRREFVEETGIIIHNSVLVRAVSHVARYVTDRGESEELHHLGFLYDVTVQYAERVGPCGSMVLPEVNSLPDGEDSRGAVWTPIVTIDPGTPTPFARIALVVGEGSR